ncbi:hypothetical protein D7D81_12990 [Halocella sp. SP3-1]|nr:hypothetical protein D7D81_12990 [Halocella sp. SP3-1]
MGANSFEGRPFTPSPSANLVDNKRQITEIHNLFSFKSIKTTSVISVVVFLYLSVNLFFD